MPAHRLNIAGHRGLPARYPENTLPGFQAALAAGADAIECDIQFTADGEAVLLHDSSLLRTAGLDQKISSLSTRDLAGISVHEPSRFGTQQAPCPLSRLAELVPLMQAYPKARAFVEIKAESLAYTTYEQVKSAIEHDLAVISSQVVLISFDDGILAYLQKHLNWPIGWVLHHYDSASEARAQAMQPDYLICNVDKIPPAPGQLWPGNWQWFLYDIVSAPVALALWRRGIAWIESWDAAELIPAYRQHASETTAP